MERMKEQIRSKLYTTNEYGFEHQVPDVQLSQEEIEWLVKNYKIRTSLDNGIPIHRTCINCQTRQLMKYENFKDPAGKTSNSFSVKCDFIPGALPPGSKDLLKKYQEESNVDSERALLYLKSTIDPVAWLSLMFGFSDDNSDWRIRDYQKEQQRCTSKRLVLRIGRRGGKTLSVAMKLLYQLFNYEVPRGSDLNGNKVIAGPEIVVITPYQAQIAGVFDAMEMLLKRNKALSSCVITGTSGALYIKTPYYRLQVQDILNEDGDIVKAGGIISGFVSGIGVKDDGSGGGTIRGTDADIIYLDEMDMIPVQTLDRVIKPLLLTRPGVILYASSTPIGKRDKFYEYCLHSPNWKEDYYPSSILPHWDETKAELENDNTKDGFNSEYMAAFTEGGFGVFKPTLVYTARAAYKYEEASLDSDWWKVGAKVKERSQLIKVLGIDWNKNAGSEFVVVAYDPIQHHWFVIDAVNVSASEYSSVRFKEEVIRLNLKWEPDFIYADEGYGHHIIEDLLLEANSLKGRVLKNKLEVETSKLDVRLKSFNFSQNVELRNPVDNTPITKSGKEFLVENTIRVFEEQRIWFPEDDNVLLKQLLNYIIIRRNKSNNKPVYGPENSSIGDHRLDAFMLALAGIFLESSIYSPNNYSIGKPILIDRETLKTRGGDSPTSIRAKDLIKSKELAGLHLNVLEISRSNSNEPINNSTKRARGDIGKSDQDPLLKRFIQKAKSYAGYESDEEWKYQQQSMLKSRVARRPKRTYSGRGRRR